MSSGLKFLVAAKRCEIANLQQLAQASALVRQCARAIHELQRERGLSNLYLGSGGERFGGPLGTQVALTDSAVDSLRNSLNTLDLEERGQPQGARLFSRMAYALQGLDALAALREAVRHQRWRADEATAAYVRLIAALLAVVFEAADHASDPEISRLLVALFNLMQGKEFTGQERACGAAMFASGRADATRQQRLIHLIESQERCLRVFHDFTSRREPLPLPTELERLRRVACTAADGGELDTRLSHTWFEANTQRIDGMRELEETLAQDLHQLCERRIASAEADLRHHLAMLARVSERRDDALDFFRAETPAVQATPATQRVASLDHSILDLVHDQAQRLQAMADELETARASLTERKLIERAKGLLMAHRQLSEDEAHKLLRTMAMNQNRRLVDVAQALLSMATVLHTR